MTSELRALRKIERKANGLSRETLFAERQKTGYMEQAHYNPRLKEMVILETWNVPDAGCISMEQRVFRSFKKINDFVLYASTT